jgi:two-component system response regulator FixJ
MSDSAMIRTACIVDDDAFDHATMAKILSDIGVDFHVYSDPHLFIADLPALAADVLFLDVRMPQMTGLDVLDVLAAQGIGWPVVMMSGQSDIGIAVKAMQKGAVDFLEKPCSMDAVQAAFQLVSSALNGKEKRSTLKRFDVEQQITPRELQIMELLVQGHANKSVAYELGISEKTVEVHRAKLMKRLGLRSFAELVRVGVEAGIGRRIA